MPIIFFTLIIFVAISYSQDNYVQDLPKKGEGIQTMLKNYYINPSDDNIELFKNINTGKFTSRGGLILNTAYNLPIKRYNFNGKTIRSTIGNNDFEFAKRIEIYNDNLVKFGVKPENFRIDKDLWVPTVKHSDLLDAEDAISSEDITETKTTSPKKTSEIYEPLFGDKYANIKVKSNDLEGYVIYLVSGHGGPDPGAIGYKGNYELHEDEYAYDVTLRLARNLMEHSATVYVIIQDPYDGIRDDSYLNNSKNEVHIDGTSIPINQLARLSRRVEIINEYYNKHKATAKHQIAIETHVDSRSYGKRLDIFFYHSENSSEGKALSEHLKETIRQKYAKAQPGRGYQGTVSARNLYMIRNTAPVMCFLELGNIRNSEDQVRFIEKNNRQAIANWLFDGLHSYLIKN